MNYELKDQFAEDIDKKGFADCGHTSYKAILFGTTDQPAIEKVTNGNREIIVGRNGNFSSLEHANLWAVSDAELCGLFN